MGGAVSVLGPVRVGTRALGTGVQARIVAFLAARANSPVASDRLIDAVWGDNPAPGSKGTLQVHIHRIRKLLDQDQAEHRGVAIVTSEAGYTLISDTSGLDTLAFEDLVRLAGPAMTDGRIAEAEGLLESATGLWRGEPFGGLGADLGLDGDLARLEEKYLGAQESLSEVRIQLGKADLGRLRSLVDDAPLRERRWGQLMLALYRAGRQAHALRTYREAETRLREELGIDPGPELRRLEEQILLQDPGLDCPRLTVLTGLPSHPDRLIGRSDEVAALATWFERHRVVTLTGLGGIGKTRLAVAAADHASPAFGDGVGFVDLSRVEGGDGVTTALLDTLGVPSATPGRSALEAALEFLRDGRRLLLIDNAEHVTEAAREMVDEIVSRCRRVHLVITSRTPLGARGEHLWQVQPLSLEQTDPGLPSAAIEFLIETAERFDRGFRLDPELHELAGQVCSMAGGIPLAIQLLASKLRDRSLADLAADLDRGSVWPVRNLSDIVQWTIGQLDPAEQSALCALSVFRGGWDREAAAAVLAGVQSDTRHLSRLVDLSLVGFDPVSNRFSMLEPVRATAQEVGAETSRRAALGHAAYFVGLAQEALPQLNGIDQTDWYHRFETDEDNFRAVLERGLRERDPSVVAALPSLGLFWFRRAHPTEGAGWFDRFEDVFDLVGAGQPFAALQSAHNAMWAGRPDSAEERLARLEPGARAMAAAPLVGRVLHSRGNVIGWGRGHPAASLGLFKEAFEVLAPANDPLAVVSAASEAYMSIRAGESERAKSLMPELIGASELSESFGAMAIDQVRGLTALYEGDLAEAERLLSRSLGQIDGMGLMALRGPLLVPLIWTSLLSARIEEAEVRAQAAYRFVADDNGGWRLGEVCSALGAIAIAKSDLVSARSWFTRGYRAALQAPEIDLVLWNAAGLVEVAAWPGDGVRSEAGSAIRRMLDDYQLAIPVGVGDSFPGVSAADPHPGRIALEDLKRTMREGLHGQES